ncbi:MAG: 50S ribosomal protein L15 [Clostridiales bacterium]
MRLEELKPVAGSNKKAFRKGRGHSTGNGKTAGRGHKGQNSRAGGGVRIGFEGGQMPLYRRLPKRGFNNKRFAKVYTEVRIEFLNKFNDGEIVNAETLKEKGIVKKVVDGIVVLGNSEVNKKLTVQVARITKTARANIEAVGGKVEVV